MSEAAPQFSLTEIEATLECVLAPWVRQLGLRAEAVDARGVTLRLPFSESFRHAGGVVCGQVLMSAADTAMIVAVASALGAFRPMTTVTLTTNFMRPVIDGDVLVRANVLRLGKTVVFGEIELTGTDGKLAVQATTTYALL
ncbi:phenylacetic acid degradation-like protein [Cupriavidus necator N-1]|uniref:Phenylacetic acid degradation-like protein n=1 Tax=Cupriavidus necator (strain ATCC 43291 / DSM 13513 / CCUG 52238 / LMG 8453 / N-1) TaxID=1042878 RepID=G0F0T0_CUPNN|nr:PaaI family thioesterase [Cupriavidus necator]AEI78966.1 phenylacetic acid degradation-like protein [Cupriavidus necator N-1]MDX6012510.1 PaaI family thioesterase [Cupriavidus necator]